MAAVASPGGGGSPRVYRVVNGKAQAVTVRLGTIVDDKVVVEGDLEPGQLLVVVGLNNLADGRPVEILQ